jgi:uncharacterized membrane protein YeaQ/YmgE (transglycosylase-associated protein family)
MSEEIKSFLLKVAAIPIYLGIGAVISWIYYYMKRRDLFGGFIGGLVVAVIGAIIGGFILDKLLLDITVQILNFLARDTGVNIIFGFIGGYAAVYVMNRLNHDRERKKY